MKNISCKACSNIHCFIKQYCSADWIQNMDKKKFQTLYKQGQNIIHEGSPVLGIFFIQNGKVKVFSSGLNGRKQIVRFAKDGHILGHRGFATNDVYPISATAMEDSVACFIENDTLYKMFMDNPKFVIGLMEFYSRELRKIENRMKSIAQMNTREKITEALLLLMENFGLNKQKELNVPITREEIACIAGTTAEQVVRQLSEFEKEKLISKRGRKIMILNIGALKKINSEFNPITITQ